MLFRSMISDLRHDPLRALLTVLGIGLGSAVVMLTVNVGNSLLAGAESGFSTPGYRMIVEAAQSDGRGGLSHSDVNFALSDMAQIRRTVPGVHAVSPVLGLWVTPTFGVDFSLVEVGGERYKTRSALAVGPEYFQLYDLHLVAGDFFSQGDIDQGKRVVVISQSAAEGLFGSVLDAVGETFSVNEMPGPKKISYEVGGVFADVAPDLRDSYDIADFLVPVRLPPPYVDAFAVWMDAASPGEAAQRLSSAMKAVYGPDLKVLSWRGNRWDMEDPRSRNIQEIQSVTLFLDGFGALALIVASTGILTMLMVSLVERARSIGLRRALGETQAAVAVSFVLEAMILAGVGALLGMLLAWLFSGPAYTALAPMLPGEGKDSGTIVTGLRTDSLVVGLAAALAAAGLFALAPAISAARVLPTEGMREA